MSFRFKGQTITLENYKQIFSVCSPDILDEIRLAILDDTQISTYINGCGNDSFKLGQIRKAIRELVPLEYLSTLLTGETIAIIREMHSKQRDASELLKYIGVLEPEVIEKLAHYILVGTDIKNMDFTIVPTNLVDIVCSGLYKGYPMWLLIESPCYLDEAMIRVLMRGMSLGLDIHPFIKGDWKVDSLYLLFSYVKTVDISSFVSKINKHFDTNSIKVLLDLLVNNVDITKLCIKDTDGYPVYNSYQMFELGLAIEDGTITDEMFKVTLSDMDIALLHEKELAKRNRKLNVNLKKNS